MKPKLETTKDYNLFRFHKEQRPINPHHVKGLRQSMEKLGFLPSKPLQCVRNCSALILIDGHHRLEAARSLGLPVTFVVEESADRETVTLVNSKTKAWGMGDFIRSQCVRGNAEYKKLRTYIEGGLPTGIAANLLVGRSAAGNGSASARVRDGSYKVVTTKQADALLDFINALKGSCAHVQNAHFIKALSLVWYVKEFDMGTFKARMLTNPSMLPRCSNTEDYLRAIEEIYNFRARARVAIAFLAREEARKRADKGAAMEKESA